MYLLVLSSDNTNEYFIHLMAVNTEHIVVPTDCPEAINIVVVDDDRMSLECVKRFLRGAYCELTLFDQTPPALQHLIAHQPVLLFVDMNRPTITGVEFLTALSLQDMPLDSGTYLQSAVKPPQPTYDFASALGVNIVLNEVYMNKRWLHEATQNYREQRVNAL
jgi:response regulator RpfG family c-di-GMP phosphodiesterase